MKNIWMIIGMSAGLLLWGCSEEDDCTGCNLNPKIKLNFQAVNLKKATEAEYKLVKAEMQQYRDSLKAVSDPEIVESLSEKISALRIDSLFYDEKYNQLRVGKILIDGISSPGAAHVEQFQDTLIRNFAVPVDMQHDTSTFFFKHNNRRDTLQLIYQRDIVHNLEGMRMKLFHIDVNEELSTFDSVRVKCYNSPCSNDITMIYVYF